jgi:hypothetical protein
MKRAVILGLGIVLMLGLSAGSSQAKPKKVKVDTEVTIDYQSGDFFGDVMSEKPRCERGRGIEVGYLGPPGQEPGDPISSEGTTTSDDDGSWLLTVGPAEGYFEAAADKRKFKKRRNGKVRKIIVCKSGVSPPVLVI